LLFEGDAMNDWRTRLFEKAAELNELSRAVRGQKQHEAYPSSFYCEVIFLSLCTVKAGGGWWER
jgi:hypothetical protein